MSAADAPSPDSNAPAGGPPRPISSQSGTSGWRSEEDYVFARLAVAMGVLNTEAVNATLQAQAQAATHGDPLSFTQVAMRDGRVPPAAVIHVKAEMAKSLRVCPQCGLQRYLAAGPYPRQEPCPQCGGPIPVPAVNSSLSASSAARREGAFQMTQGARHFQGADPFNARGQGPKLFGNFVIEGEIAKGGMGAIYRARHAGTGQIQALKVLLAGDRASKGQLHRFKREARAQLELDHPNIVKIHEAGEWEGILYYTMDLVDGRGDLSKYQALQVTQRLALMAEVARALHYCHNLGYVHRDLKPGNILLGPSDRPLLTDFGLAKNIGGDTRLTKEGSVLGTPYYMSPEQATGQVEKMGPKTDIWALGVLVYEMATGALPFMAETALELYRKICEDDPEPLSEHGVEDEYLQAIIYKAIEKDVDDRYATAEDLAIDLERYLRGEPPLAEMVSSATRMFRKVKKHKKSIKFLGGIAGAGVGVLALVLVAFSLILWRFASQKALQERGGAIVEATKQLTQALDGDDEGAALAAAVAAARALLEADGGLPDELADVGAELRLKLERALLAEGRASLTARTRGGAARAQQNVAEVLASVEARGAGAEDDDLELRLRASLMQAEAQRRLGEAAAADEALARAAELSPKDARVLLAQGLQLRGDEAAERLLAVAEARGQRQARIRAWAALGALRLRADDREGAREAFQAGFELAEDERQVSLARRVEAEAWLRAGEAAQAFTTLCAGLDEAPDLTLAERALQVGLGLGRPSQTHHALLRAARRTKLVEVELLALLAQQRLGEDVTQALQGFATQGLLEARLALARAQAWGGRADAWDALAERGERRALAGRARWRAERGQQDGARADLERLGDLLAEIPRDVPAGRDLALAVRDLGWARHLLQLEGAAEAAEAAAAGLPLDLDAALLHAEVDPQQVEAARQAFVREADSFEGALARGLFLGRLAHYRADARFARLARPFLRARLIDCPALTPAQALLAEARVADGVESSPAPAAPGADALDWQALLPPVEAPAPVTPAQLQQVNAILLEAGKLNSADKWAESQAKALEAVAIAPHHKPALWDYAERLNDPKPEEPAFVAFLAFVRECPSYFLPVLFRFYEDSVKNYLIMVEMPKDHWSREGPLTLDQRGLGLMLQLMGRLYPDETKPQFLPPEHALPTAEVLRQAGELLREDPSLAWLVSLIAHVRQLSGDLDGARRDLQLFMVLVEGDTDQNGKSVSVVANLHRAWILGESEPKQALDGLLKIPREALGEKPSRQVILWLETDPRMEAVRGLRGLAKFKANLGEGKH